MIKHILFDNDGTLVDTEIIAVRSTLRLLAETGFQMDEKEYCKRYPGLRERDILARLQAAYGVVVPDDYFERLRALHQYAFEHELKAIEGMPDIFNSVKAPKSVVSNGSTRHVRHCLEKTGLLEAFSGDIFSAEQVENPKPHPDLYELALESLKLHKTEAIVIEDSPTGVEAAKRAGLKVVGFLGASHIFDGHGEHLQDIGADWLAENAEALKRLLTQLSLV